MKTLIAVGAIGLSLLTTSPAFAYEVQSGDTMGKIAQSHELSLQELASLNPQVKDVNKIYVGQIIKTERDANSNVAPVVTQNSKVTDYEKDLLARLVRAEAESEPYAGKVAVATVVLNRVDSPDFPNTVTEVINQKGQFSPVASGAINKPADAESIKAVNEALASDRSRGAGSLYFYNPATCTSHWLDSRPTTVVIGNHVFKK